MNIDSRKRRIVTTQPVDYSASFSWANKPKALATAELKRDRAPRDPQRINLGNIIRKTCSPAKHNDASIRFQKKLQSSLADTIGTGWEVLKADLDDRLRIHHMPATTPETKTLVGLFTGCEGTAFEAIKTINILRDRGFAFVHFGQVYRNQCNNNVREQIQTNISLNAWAMHSPYSPLNALYEDQNISRAIITESAACLFTLENLLEYSHATNATKFDKGIHMVVPFFGGYKISTHTPSQEKSFLTRTSDVALRYSTRAAYNTYSFALDKTMMGNSIIDRLIIDKPRTTKPTHGEARNINAKGHECAKKIKDIDPSHPLFKLKLLMHLSGNDTDACPEAAKSIGDKIGATIIDNPKDGHSALSRRVRDIGNMIERKNIPGKVLTTSPDSETDTDNPFSFAL